MQLPGTNGKEQELLLEVKDLRVRFNDDEVLSNINFGLHRGDVLAILGPNGAGKTVLLRTLLGLVPYEGVVRWQPGVKVGYVPQKFVIDREMPLSLKEFLSLRYGPRGISDEECRRALAQVGMLGTEGKDNVLRKRMGILSAGQIQRVLVAYSLLGYPDVILFDEPTTGIDIGGEETIYNLLHRLDGEQGKTIVLVSHDLAVVYKHAKKVVCVSKQMMCYGVPQDVLDPNALIRLYGREAAFYKHDHHD